MRHRPWPSPNGEKVLRFRGFGGALPAHAASIARRPGPGICEALHLAVLVAFHGHQLAPAGVLRELKGAQKALAKLQSHPLDLRRRAILKPYESARFRAMSPSFAKPFHGPARRLPRR